MAKKKVFATLLCMSLVGTCLFAQKKEKTPDEWGKSVPWQYWGNVTTLPAIQNASVLSDGDIKTGAGFTGGGEAGGEIAVKFPQEIEVTMFRFVQGWIAATHYKVFADVEGKGEFTALVAERKDEKPVKNEWIELPINKKVHGLKFVATAGELPYRKSFPFLMEVEIYSPEKIKAPALPIVGGPRPQTGAVKATPSTGKRKIDIRICTDQWNYGLGGWEKVRDKTPLGEYAGYRNLVLSLKELDANSVRFFDETLCGANGKFPFPTKLDPEHCYDWLKPLTDELKKDGYSLHYFTHAWKPPFQKRGEMAPMPWARWDYPYHQSDTLIGLNKNYKVAYPCVLCNDDFRSKWEQMMRDALANGATGVYLMPDEYFFKGHNLARANCVECTAEFKKMFGYDSMPKTKELAADDGGYIGAPVPDDTEKYRKWKLFEYIKLSEVFKTISANLRKEFPNAILTNSDCQGTAEAHHGRLEHTIASDIIGADPNADFAQVYGAAAIGPVGSHAAFIKRFEASAGKEKLLSSAGWGQAKVNSPVATYNGILSEVMLGAKALEVYRHNYMYMGNGISVYKKTFRMVRLLEEWGIMKAEVPETVCMLFSRASEDWYYTKVASMLTPESTTKRVEFYLHLADESINKTVASETSDDMERFIKQDRMRGVGANRVMETILTTNGIPYKVAYPERADNMKDLKRFKTIVIPFAYSLSKNAVAELKTALEAGTKLIIFEQLAPTDEYGNPHEKPLLEEFIDNPNVTFVKESLFDNSCDMRKMNEYGKLISNSIKETGYSFAYNGSRVTYLVTKLADDKGYILYLANHAERGSNPASVTIGLPGEGEYKMETYSSDSNEINENLLNGSTVIPAKALGRFSIGLFPQELKLIHIYK